MSHLFIRHGMHGSRGPKRRVERYREPKGSLTRCCSPNSFPAISRHGARLVAKAQMPQVSPHAAPIGIRIILPCSKGYRLVVQKALLMRRTADGEREGQLCDQEAAMERFLSPKHRRYLQILADPRDEAQRNLILKLLNEEEFSLRETPSKNKPPEDVA
jgi:hypothetical protein